MTRYTKKAHKNMPWSGWGKLAPKGAERTRMFRKCGQRCFLGKHTPGDKQHPDFPICTKGTCKVNSKGLYAAFVRAKQWGKSRKSYKGDGHPRLKQKDYKRIARTAKRMLRKRGIKVGK